jgi:hypothetical protein
MVGQGLAKGRAIAFRYSAAQGGEEMQTFALRRNASLYAGEHAGNRVWIGCASQCWNPGLGVQSWGRLLAYVVPQRTHRLSHDGMTPGGECTDRLRWR